MENSSEDKKEMTLDDLAQMVQRGFQAAANDTHAVHEEVTSLRTEMDSRFNAVEGKLDAVEQEVKAVREEQRRHNHVCEADIIDLDMRLKRVEEKVGVGK